MWTWKGDSLGRDQLEGEDKGKGAQGSEDRNKFLSPSGLKERGEEGMSQRGELVQSPLYAFMELSQQNILVLWMYASWKKF
jgi:hypothetical protein